MVAELEKFSSLVKNGSQKKEGLLFEQIFFIKTKSVHSKKKSFCIKFALVLLFRKFNKAARNGIEKK